MMDELISRKEVIKAIEDEWDGCLGEYNSAHIIRDTCEAIDRIASAQPEIIHCEFCKHWKNNHLCECLSRYGTFDTPKDFFCGYGKAK